MSYAGAVLILVVSAALSWFLVQLIELMWPSRPIPEPPESDR
jgi:hypothetical protein